MALEKDNTKKKGSFFKSLFFFIIFIAVCHLGIFIFLNLKGKDIIKEAIRKNYNIEAEIGALSLRFPFTVVIKDFKCADLSFKEANAVLGWINPFTRHFTLHRIYINSLNLKIKREKDNVSLSPFFTKGAAVNSDETSGAIVKELFAQTNISPKLGSFGQEQRRNFSFKIGKLYLKNCYIEFLDLTQMPPITYIFKNASLELKHFVYPGLPKFYVKINASLEKESLIMQDMIDIRGWVDYAHKNMDLDVNVNNVDYAAFSEYYSSFWKPDNLGVKEALLSFNSKFNASDNDLIIEGVLSLDKIEFLELNDDKSNAKLLRTIILVYKGDSDKATLPIRLKTKMDSFKLDFSSIQYDFKDKIKIGPIVFIQNAVEKAKDIISQKKEQAGEKTKEIKDVTIEKVDKTIGIIKDVLGAVVKIEPQDKLQSNVAAQEPVAASQLLQPQVTNETQISSEPPAGIEEKTDIQLQESLPQPAGQQNIGGISQEDTQAEPKMPAEENVSMQDSQAPQGSIQPEDKSQEQKVLENQNTIQTKTQNNTAK
jgi:rRNA processing protein Gar1